MFLAQILVYYEPRKTRVYMTKAENVAGKIITVGRNLNYKDILFIYHHKIP